MASYEEDSEKARIFAFLCILPLLSFWIDRLGQGESAGMAVGLVLEAEGQGTGTKEEFLSMLRKQEGVLQFLLYEDESEVRQAVEKGELDCGVFLPEDLWEGLYTGAWQDTVTLYVTSSSSMTEIVKEKIASVLFTLYSERNYVNYIEQSEVFAAAGKMNERADADIEDIVSFARAAYETHLLDGSTFDFQYRGNIGNNNGAMSDELSETTSAFRLRGILAVCIFLSGLCGLLTDWKDREEKRFVRFAPPFLTTMVNIWLPTLFTSVITLFSLLLTGQTALSAAGDLRGPANLLPGIGKEMAALIFYQFLIVLYCSIIRVVLKKQETIAAAIPLLTLASVVCCPVWIRLAVYVPFFRVLEKFFPVTYYLFM